MSSKSYKTELIEKSIQQYLTSYFDFINEYDKYNDTEKYSDGKSGFEKKQQVLDDYNERFGIVGGAVLIANNNKNTFEILLEDEKKDVHENFFHISWDLKEERIKEGEFIQALLSSTTNNKKFDSGNILNFPKYFLNLPPVEWQWSFPRSKFEKEIIKDNNINYQVCFVEEILFFNYFWRYLIRMAKCFGLEHNLSMNNVPGAGDKMNGNGFDLLDEAFWINHPGLPEHDFHMFLKDLANNSDKEADIRIWREYLKKERIDYKDKVFDIDKEWENLCIKPLNDSSEMSDEDLNCIYNLRQLLCFTIDLVESKNLKKELSSEYKEISKWFNFIDNAISEFSYKYKKENVEYVNYDKADFIKHHYTNALKKTINKKNEQGHGAFINICLRIFNDVISSNLASSKELFGDDREPTIGNFLKALHAYSRFPILPSYFLTYFSGKAIVHDYFVFPLLISDQYTINATNFTSEEADYKVKQVVLVMCYIEPIWTNEAFSEIGLKLKKETNKTVEGFKINQLFYTKIARRMIDGYFYGTYFKEQVKVEERTENFKVFKHNIKLHLNKALIKLKERNSEFNIAEVRDTIELAIKVVNLSEFALKPQEYLESNKSKIRSINLVDTVAKIRDIIRIDVIKSKGELIKLERRELYEFIKEKFENGTLIDEEYLSNGKRTNTIEINSYPEVIDIILKDIIGNAIANAVNIESLSEFQNTKPIGIKLEERDNLVSLSITNNSEMPLEYVELLLKKELATIKDEASMPWGLLITSNYCHSLNYKIESKVRAGKTEVTIVFTKNPAINYD